MMDRRRVLKHGVVALAAAGVGLAAPRLDAWAPRPQALLLASRATGERIEVALPGFEPAALTGVARVLRDPVTGEQHAIDPELLVALVEIAAAIGVPPAYEVLCGYRSPRRHAAGLHGCGRALDLRLAGVTSARLAAGGAALARGGVGHYRAADFVHLDTGATRSWSG